VNRSVEKPLRADLVASRVTDGLQRLDRLRPRQIVKIAKDLPDLIDRRLDDCTVDTLTHESTSLE
jgi:hypothetical protein